MTRRRGSEWVPLARATYAAAGLFAVLPAIPVVAVGSLLSPRWRAGLGERLGSIPPGVDAARARVPRIWIHAASIGEVRAAHPLLARLRQERPEAGIYLTTTTPEGANTARALRLADGVGLLPVDLPGLPGRLFDRLRPDALVLLETELWPELLHAARRRSIPALVLNGRLSQRSFRRYRCVRGLLAPVLDDVTVFEIGRAHV